MKKMIVLAALLIMAMSARAEYEQVNMTVFGMDCAPCAHAIHVSMTAIPGVGTVNVDLNSGLVSIALNSGNSASMKEFNAAVEKNGFTHKDAKIVARGKLTGTAAAPVFEVSGTGDRYQLEAGGAAVDVTSLLGKTVTVKGTLPQAAKGKTSARLNYASIEEAR